MRKFIPLIILAVLVFSAVGASALSIPEDCGANPLACIWYIICDIFGAAGDWPT